MNYLYFPILNPISLREVTPATSAQYLTKHFSDYRFQDTLQMWEEHVGYCQKFQTSDVTPLQFISNFSPVSIAVIDDRGYTYITQNAVPVRLDKYNPGFYAYETTITWAGLAQGCYFVQLSTGGQVSMISEPIYISEIIENTLFLQYRNSRYHEDVIFETGIRFGLRVEGTIGRLTPGSNDLGFQDQKLNPYLINSKPYNGFKLSLGGNRGVPDWMIQKFNYLWSCNDVTIDGKSYAKAPDGKMDLLEETNYPMRAVQMEIREGTNRGSKVISPDVDTSKKLVVVHNISSRVFGDLASTAGSSTIRITAIE